MSILGEGSLLYIPIICSNNTLLELALLKCHGKESCACSMCSYIWMYVRREGILLKKNNFLYISFYAPTWVFSQLSDVSLLHWKLIHVHVWWKGGNMHRLSHYINVIETVYLYEHTCIWHLIQVNEPDFPPPPQISINLNKYLFNILTTVQSITITNGGWLKSTHLSRVVSVGSITY